MYSCAQVTCTSEQVFFFVIINQFLSYVVFIFLLAYVFCLPIFSVGLYFLCVFQESYEGAKHTLKTHAKEHKNLAEALLTYETLDAKEIQIVLEGKKLEVR